jgi:hypothetical protein
MKGLEGIYVIDRKSSEVLFSYDTFIQGSGEWDLSLLSNIVTAFQGLAVEFGEKETKLIEFGEKKLFTSISEEYDIFFILRCSKKVNDEKFHKLLSQIKHMFIKNLRAYSLSPEEIKFVKTSIFGKDLSAILKIKTNVSEFLSDI